MRLRPVPADEAGRVVDAVFAGLSPRSRYLRFHSPVPQMSDALRRHLVDLDARNRAAIVAEVVHGGRATPIGLVELADVGGGSADLAVAVVDSWQRHGIGRRLLAAAVDLAERLGQTELRGLVLRENEAMRRLARRAFPQATTVVEDETVELVAPIGPAAWTITQEDVLADLLHRGD